MVAKIISGKSIIGALNYNENKVVNGKADLIWESGFHKDIHQMDFHDKLLRFKDLTMRNERTKTNTVHISLNFAIGEKLHIEKLNNIANYYMENIGFGDQPYLVYLHHDAGHPHVHIVTTNIKPSGERISLHNLGKTKSETARKLIEQQYDLIPATRKEKQKQESISLRKVDYGKVDTKRAISNVVRSVVDSYKFTSIPEFNAVLGHYNVAADRGSKESRMYGKNGLLYWALDSKGEKIGVPIKASSIYGSPTMKNLALKFNLNANKRIESRDQLKYSIDIAMKAKASPNGFKLMLQAKGIDVVFRTNVQGRLYGVTFVDHLAKVVFNGSDLGKSYSAAALNDWFIKAQSPQPTIRPTKVSFHIGANNHFKNQLKTSGFRTLLDDLIQPELQEGDLFAGLVQNKRKKKRKRLF